MSYEHSPEHPLTVAYPYFPPEERERLGRDLQEALTGWVSMGPRVKEFEERFAAFCGVTRAVAFPSCTASLEAALIALGVKPGDEVLVPVETFIATGMAVHAVGARPVFVETDPDTMAMDFGDALARAGDRTRGAIVVHFGGVISPALPAFVGEMRARGMFVIEDAAHAPGAELNGVRAGAIGDAGCFSFYPTKVMTTGEGGMLTTSNEKVAAVARSLQNRGRDMDALPAELYVLPGRNNRMTEMAAAMGVSQLRSLPGFLERRRAVARIYDEAFRDAGIFRPIGAGPGGRPAYWRYTVIAEVELDRGALQRELATRKITVDWAYDPPLHLQPVCRELYGTREGMLPRSEALLKRHVCLPVHARLRDEDAAYVAEQVLSVARELTASVAA